MRADEEERGLAVGGACSADELEPVVEAGLGELLGEVEADDVQRLGGQHALQHLVRPKVPHRHPQLLQPPHQRLEPMVLLWLLLWQMLLEWMMMVMAVLCVWPCEEARQGGLA